MPKAEDGAPKLQFLLTENQLTDIYSSINHAIGPATLRTQILLSKPEKEFITAEVVYEDCYILTLSREETGELIGTISSNSDAGMGRIASLVQRSLQQGLMQRESK
jgi:hypothetical protein